MSSASAISLHVDSTLCDIVTTEWRYTVDAPSSLLLVYGQHLHQVPADIHVNFLAHVRVRRYAERDIGIAIPCVRLLLSGIVSKWLNVSKFLNTV